MSSTLAWPSATVPKGHSFPKKIISKAAIRLILCAFEDNGTHYLMFGGLWGGQLQRLSQ